MLRQFTGKPDNNRDVAEALFAQGLEIACARLVETAVHTLRQVICQCLHGKWPDDAQMALAISYYHQEAYFLACRCF